MISNSEIFSIEELASQFKDGGLDTQYDIDMDYYCAVKPPVILSLIERLKQSEKIKETLAKELVKVAHQLQKERKDSEKRIKEILESIHE